MNDRVMQGDKSLKYILEEGRITLMSDKIIENNQVTIIGEIAGKFVFSHEVFGEGFYMVDVGQTTQ